MSLQCTVQFWNNRVKLLRQVQTGLLCHLATMQLPLLRNKDHQPSPVGSQKRPLGASTAVRQRLRLLACSVNLSSESLRHRHNLSAMPQRDNRWQRHVCAEAQAASSEAMRPHSSLDFSAPDVLTSTNQTALPLVSMSNLDIVNFHLMVRRSDVAGHVTRGCICPETGHPMAAKPTMRLAWGG